MSNPSKKVAKRETKSFTEQYIGTEAGLLAAVGNVVTTLKAKPSIRLSSVHESSTSSTLEENAAKLAAWSSEYVATMQEWQSIYTAAVTALFKYPSGVNTRHFCGEDMNGKRLARIFTHGGLVAMSKAVRKYKA